jgi:(p)ppGpp synthase/HD superfamily hydrolase
MTRDEFIEEMKLRKFIRKAIKITEKKKNVEVQNRLLEEQKLRGIIKKLLVEKDVDSDTKPAPATSTPESVLKAAFNKILSVIESGLRSLSEPEERRSYRIHTLEKFKNIFKNLEGMHIPSADSTPAEAIGETGLEEADEDIAIDVEPDDPSAPARVVPDIEKKRFEKPKKSKEESEEEEFEKFRVPDLDPTGARIAYETIETSNIKNVIQSSLTTLYKPEYKKQFKEFTLYNVDLWLLTYEQELAKEKGQQPAFSDTIIPEPQGAQPTGQRASSIMGSELEDTFGM